ncbi:phosphoadenosine phosphosulfate reductase [Capnocytophaga granulosa]|uniref:Adenosine 5'-phosphosulfate reductase n=1 Tax=Capnocytophaga granulosa TaxID=45242 RepID=A0A1H2RMN6_9FLAO|nr:phosphoadenylyl-sulfate reductase [Capnocytophaga granulosa]EPD30099.1 adenylylsulfate reductase, thioredoxin dependent [Capnocytophaga granulosa ATCC 51502]SDW20753.1 phosphoadenosine phosphosulfate reductase [Capnocytophaga granulosa]SUX20776.1 Phosphoadenosine phosphosulfate reductase [Capnocytophaga granulosa]
MHPDIDSLLTATASLTETEILALLTERYPDKVVFSTSFGMEDQVITDFIMKGHFPVKIFTLDTGRLFYETYTTWQLTNEYYHTKITPYYPDAKAIEEYVQDNGINAFYQSVPLRHACCHIRKVEPLKRALQGNKVWITGLRAEQSPHREQMPMVEWDESNQIIKVHLLLHWKTEQVLSFLRSHGIPYNPLHDKGYPSIGCAPCTRAVKEGEDFRAGRWWWEHKTNKECGLHVHK